MESIKLRAIVLQETNHGESDKRITVLSKEHGKLSIYCKGARKSTSKFIAGVQPFCYCDFVVGIGDGFYTLNTVDVIESFYKVREDINKLAYACFMIELVSKTILEGDEYDDIMLLLLRTLMVTSSCEPERMNLITDIFQLKLLECHGYMPELEMCTECGRDITNERTILFSPNSGGCVCRACRSIAEDSMQISKGTYDSIKYIFGAELKKLFSFKVSDTVQAELTNVVGRTVYHHTDVKLNSEQFINDLSNNPY